MAPGPPEDVSSPSSPNENMSFSPAPTADLPDLPSPLEAQTAPNPRSESPNESPAPPNPTSETPAESSSVQDAEPMVLQALGQQPPDAVFKTMDEAKECLDECAIENGFAIAIKASSSKGTEGRKEKAVMYLWCSRSRPHRPKAQPKEGIKQRRTASTATSCPFRASIHRRKDPYSGEASFLLTIDEWRHNHGGTALSTHPRYRRHTLDKFTTMISTQLDYGVPPRLILEGLHDAGASYIHIRDIYNFQHAKRLGKLRQTKKPQDEEQEGGPGPIRTESRDPIVPPKEEREFLQSIYLKSGRRSLAKAQSPGQPTARFVNSSVGPDVFEGAPPAQRFQAQEEGLRIRPYEYHGHGHPPTPNQEVQFVHQAGVNPQAHQYQYPGAPATAADRINPSQQAGVPHGPPPAQQSPNPNNGLLFLQYYSPKNPANQTSPYRRAPMPESPLNQGPTPNKGFHVHQYLAHSQPATPAANQNDVRVVQQAIPQGGFQNSFRAVQSGGPKGNTQESATVTAAKSVQGGFQTLQQLMQADAQQRAQRTQMAQGVQKAPSQPAPAQPAPAQAPAPAQPAPTPAKSVPAPAQPTPTPAEPTPVPQQPDIPPKFPPRLRKGRSANARK